MNEQLHWNEGLYLEPHHLQALQRTVFTALAGERRFTFHYPYGLVELKLSADAMENHLISFDRLTVVMPSGLTVQVPENSDLQPLNIKNAYDASTAPLTVSLGLPLWHPERANSIERADEARARRIYRVVERSLHDENTGENPQPVPVRRLNARLILEGDDTTDMEVLPLVRIIHPTGQEGALPRQDPHFVPPCLVFSGSPVLRDLVRDLSNRVEATRKTYEAKMARGFDVENMRGPQISQMMRLLILNRYTVRLLHLSRHPLTATVGAYLELRGLLAELAALAPQQSLFEAPDYDHDNPAVAFIELDAAIRALLPGAPKGRVDKAEFAPADGGLVASVTEEQLRLANEYFLAVRSRQDPTAVSDLVQDIDRFKLMSRTMMKQRVWGIRLQEERQPPIQLVSETGLIYFRLLRSERNSAPMWDLIQQEKAIAARWSGMEGSDFKLTLFMTFPEDTSANAPAAPARPDPQRRRV